MPPSVSDLVIDSKLEIKCFENHTIQTKLVPNPSPRQPRIRQQEKWERSKVLGEGIFGVVWVENCTTGPSSGELRAVKKLKNGTTDGSVDYRRELEAITKFFQERYQDHFVRSPGWYENENSVFITMEYLPLRNLEGYIKTPLDHTEARHIIQQLLEGLDLMHINNFVHRDLKPAVNMMHTGPDWWVKISDFGLSKRIEGTVLRTLVGTEAYLAPEVREIYTPDIQDDEHIVTFTTAEDIWAIGAITFRIITGHFAFPPGRKLFDYVVRGRPFPVEESMSQECSDFVMKTMTASPLQRPSSQEALSHSWILQPTRVVGYGEVGGSQIQKFQPGPSNKLDKESDSSTTPNSRTLFQQDFTRTQTQNQQLLRKEPLVNEEKKQEKDKLEDGSTAGMSRYASRNGHLLTQKKDGKGLPIRLPPGSSPSLEDANLVNETTRAIQISVKPTFKNNSSPSTSSTKAMLPLRFQEKLLQKGRVSALTFLPDGRLVVASEISSTSSLDPSRGEITVWREGKLENITELKESIKLIKSVPNGGGRFLSLSASDFCEIWTFDGGGRIWRTQEIGKVDTHMIEFSPDGRRLVVVDTLLRDRIRILEADSYGMLEPLYFLESQPKSTVAECAFSPDGCRLVVSHSPYSSPIFEILIFEENRQGRLHRTQMLAGNFTSENITFSSDGLQLVVPATNRRMVLIWKINERETEKQVDKLDLRFSSISFAPNARQCVLCFAPAARQFAFFKQHNTMVEVWDLDTQVPRRVRSFKLRDSYSHHDVCSSPNGHLLVITSKDSRTVWEADKQGNFQEVQFLGPKLLPFDS